MADRKVLCHGKDCYPSRLKYPKSEVIKHGRLNYCKDCYNKQFAPSFTRQLIFLILKKIFDLSEYESLPKFIDLQIDKYIREYGYTETGIYNTLCYIYFEYDFSTLNVKYGIYPVINEYELHHDFSFEKNVKIKEQKVNKVNTRIKPNSSQVVKKIDELELN